MRQVVSASILLSSLVVAQGVTSPRGLNSVEGNTVFYHWQGNRRFQQIDQGQAGTPMVIQSISWRRNGNVAQTPGASTLDFKLDLGRGNFGAVSTLLDNNFLAGTRTSVFNQTAVNFPDWTANVPGPAPFDFKVVLPTPYVYTGTDALVIDFVHLNGSATGLLQTDRDFIGSTSHTAGTLLGTGCVASGNTAAFSHTSGMLNADVLPTPVNGMRLQFGGNYAPAGSPVTALLDVVNQNLSGILCKTLYAGPLVTIPLGMPVGTTNTIPTISYGFPNNPAAVGAVLYSQLLALDASQTPLPIAISNGRQTTMPSASAAAPHRCSYAYTSLPSTTGIATHFIGGGMVMLLQ